MGCLNKVDWPLRMLQHRLLQHWRKHFWITVANSGFTQTVLENHGFESVMAIPNGVETVPQRPPLADPPTAIFAGRVIESKGVTLLLEAFRSVVAKIPNARLIIAGQGDTLNRLKFLTALYKLKENVTFTGFLQPDELERVAGSAWVQVVPTLNAEPFGLVAAEAAMRGSAVIASAHGGLFEIVHFSDGGVLFPPGDRDFLAEQMIDLLSDREFCETLGNTGREFALQYFTNERYLNQFLKVYKTMALHRWTPLRRSS